MLLEPRDAADRSFSGTTVHQRGRPPRWRRLRLIIAMLLLTGGAAGANPAISLNQTDEPATMPPKTVVDLQPFRRTATARVAETGRPPVAVTLIDLNPQIGRWYLLRIDRNSGTAPETFHLENPFPSSQHLRLDQPSSAGLSIVRDGATDQRPLWSLSENSALDAARRSGQAFAPLCGGRIYLRNPVKGHRTTIESVTDFMRDRLPGGDALVGFVRDTFFRDAYRETGLAATDAAAPAESQRPGFPAPARIDPRHAAQPVVPADLGIQVDQKTAATYLGRWYAVKDIPGIFVSLMQPGAVAPEILESDLGHVNRLDTVEANSLAYMVAFDLKRFDVGYSVGSEHPRVDWSERILPQMKDPNLPGPDGIDRIAPLAPVGMINPDDAARTVATFTGGFKRIHGAFRYGDLALRNHGSHYGFMESGVVLSRLQPGLATLVVLADGTLEMKTWGREDDQGLGRICHARQNGVPLVEFDSANQRPSPGRLVNRWLPGNWAGSSDKKLRTLRAGAALQQADGHRFLIYAYFSTATPSAMTRVFQAYGVRYAMHLDMNALEHTYLALYRRAGDHLLVQHLIQGMNVLDKTEKGQYVPRFLGYPDNRDFFYVMRRQGQPAP